MLKTQLTRLSRRRGRAEVNLDDLAPTIADEPPLRAELFSVDQLRQHAESLTTEHELIEGRGRDLLRARLADNEHMLVGTYALVASAVEQGRQITPAAEWLLDNFHLVEEQMRLARMHLPAGYSRELPRLLKGPLAGHPRVYHLAHEVICHVDGRVDAESLSSFVAAYQKKVTLKLGELWAIPIMLRLALIENMRRIAAQIAVDRRDRDRADYWTSQLIRTAGEEPSRLVVTLAEMVQAEPPLTSAFVVEFSRKIQRISPGLVFPATWIEQRLEERGLTIEQLTQEENQKQAADQVSIGNCIGSLRFLGAMDWREFVESMSVVDQTLRGDPAAVYSRMDFYTRDRYRHVVEDIAKHSPLSEQEVARLAVELTRTGAGRPEMDPRTGHVGYYLVSRGRRLLERECAVRFSLVRAIRHGAKHLALPLYLGGIATISLAVAAGGLYWAERRGASTGILLLAGMALVAAGSQAAVTLVNWLCTILVGPTGMPRMDFSEGIPEAYRTVVVVPTMLSSAAGIEHLVEALEVRYLANPEASLHFALLTDFVDAPQETMPDDASLLEMASAGIESLNKKYGEARDDIFFLLHRPRRFNLQQGVWMGWERKRGKLEELNTLLRVGSSAAFSRIVGRQEALQGVRYVITLDTDTQLPRDSARALVGTMAHPLNQARYDGQTGRVVEGYGILQPRVGVTLTSTARSSYARLMAGEAGIDPYTRAVSDVYQDLFEEGSFIGKGIYDVEFFERSCAGRFPENRILSHDLLEGAYARAGLVSDVLFYEDYPSSYAADVKRRHRWIRGDWQIASWLLPRAPGPAAQAVANPISALSRWKILDNLRRSLVPPAFMIILLLSWGASPLVGGGLGLVVGIILLPTLLGLVHDCFYRSDEIPLTLHLRAAGVSARRHLGQAALTLILLAHESWINADAIARTLVRLFITRRALLEWQTAGEAEAKSGATLAGFCRAMWCGPALGLVATAWCCLHAERTVTIASPLLAAWLASPGLAWWVSRSLHRYERALAQEERVFLGEVARRTWRFFEMYVTADDNWLPPDNFQEHPAPTVAHRTSPTNIGLSMLSNLGAYDLGYLSCGQVLERCARTFDTLDRMERYRGHLFNWYDTRTLQPLSPRYVSTVDSGNLAGHLLTLAMGLRELQAAPIVQRRWIEGLADTLRLVLRSAGEGKAGSSKAGRRPSPPEEISAISRILQACEHSPGSLSKAIEFLHHSAAALTALLAVVTPKDDPELSYWATAALGQCHQILEDVQELAPWLAQVSGGHPGRPAPAQPGALPADLQAKLDQLEAIPTLQVLATIDQDLMPAIDAFSAQLGGEVRDAAPEKTEWINQLRNSILLSGNVARSRIGELDALIQRCQAYAEIEFEFLYDESRHLLTIGYNVVDRRCDSSFYDLLASEARLASFIGIAQGKLPQEHWFSLGRSLTSAGGEPVLLSWSGSMFEYLMPNLVMPSYESTLLDRTCRSAVQRQIEYGLQRGVPWGISEAGYSTTDVDMNYQYRAFGVPGLGLKRGLADDLVVAPYATALALTVTPVAACANLRRLADDGLLSHCGFREAIDFTPPRLPRGTDSVIIRSFMAHHQGMILVAVHHALCDGAMIKRFASNPRFKAADLLLQERVPHAVPIFPHISEVNRVLNPDSGQQPQGTFRVFNTPSTPSPEVHLLSNGRYHVMVTAAGGGYSRLRDLSVTRWREDSTLDAFGSFCYIRERRTGTYWSAAHQPALKRAERYEAIFSQARAEYRRSDNDIDTHTQISVSPEDDIELRRITLSNRSGRRQTLELTSYAEVVLASASADAAHPVFSNLFVQTELLHDRQAIRCTRRPRTSEEKPPWMIHLMSVHGATLGEASFETDRRAFIGRHQTLADPAAMHVYTLSNTQGAVLDPIVAIRRTVVLQPEEVIDVDLVTGVADTSEAATALIEKYRDRRLADRVFELAWTHSQVTLRQLDATEADAEVFGRLASCVLYANPARRAAAGILGQSYRGQSALWGYGISGDLPIVLLRVGDVSRVDLIRQMVQAHAYWRLKGLSTDLIIWNEDRSGYRQSLQDQIMGIVASSREAQLIDKPGGIFVRRIEQIAEEDRALMQTLARAVIADSLGTLAEQIDRQARTERTTPRLIPTRAGADSPMVEMPIPPATMFNGLGGFTSDGKEYMIVTTAKNKTPAPWVNVIANPYFGTVVSESGSAYTWLENAHEFRLTPWHNDPVGDASGECLYIRDEESGRFWSPTPLPVPGSGTYITYHGFGYSRFLHLEGGIESELITYVAIDAPVKFCTVKLRNRSGRPRRLSVTAFVEWVLGEQRSQSLMHVRTELDSETGALLAYNRYQPDFAERIAFLQVSDAQRSATGSRTEFLGRNGTRAQPAAMRRTRLSGRVGSGLDPCGAMQSSFELAAGQQRTIVFLLGAGQSLEDVHTLLKRFTMPDGAEEALEVVRFSWERTLEAVTIETQDPTVDYLFNGWLPYQVLSCRYWGRSGFYQSGGAFGFRDQLQDVLALLHSMPGIVRTHLLRCAEHQFRQGDVQHWWHPPQGRGVRTHFSDDYLWLPYAVCCYVTATGDDGVLGEPLAFLEGRPVKPDEEGYYDLPLRSDDQGTLYEHCIRALDYGLKFGAHGLPLMGCGDWNDGMNQVGDQGQGESVWLAFFLYDVLTRFAELADRRKDSALAERFRLETSKLKENIEAHAWDGQWYRRAYFDDGTPLGSAENPECQIDSLPQSWAVLSGAGEPSRCKTAMEAVDARLVQRQARLIQLFTPPFDKSPLEPGYIKGYLPGVRENGGQYTHAAVWTVMAIAAMGDAQRAWEMFALINPIGHGSTSKDIQVYQVEPYVVAADVYANPQHVGRGGWTWYTGSAGWMYRLILESLLGVRREGNRLRVEPCVPPSMKRYVVHYRNEETMHNITVSRNSGREVTRVLFDGVEQQDRTIPLRTDGQTHHAEVEIG